jgi:hypothetical protein
VPIRFGRDVRHARIEIQQWWVPCRFQIAFSKALDDFQNLQQYTLI